MECRILKSQRDCSEWDDFVQNAPGGRCTQTFWWSTPLQSRNLKVQAVTLASGNQIVGGALFRVMKVPGLGKSLLECIDGPILPESSPDLAEAFSERLNVLAREASGYAVSFRDPPANKSELGLEEALHSARRLVKRQPGNRRLVLWLGKEDPASVRHAFQSRSIRSALKKADSRCSEFRRLVNNDELQRAYQLWDGTASRLGISRPRPWRTLFPALRHATDQGRGETLGAFAEGRLISAVFVSYVGGSASWMYSGSAEDARYYNPTHRLVVMMVEEAIHRGLDRVDMGVLASDPANPIGVDRFKMAFGAVVERPADTLVWIRSPLLFRMAQTARGSSVGRQVEKAVRRLILPH